ncbi:MAG TPA: GWxTD domain-containing protein [Acidobacteriota bacterium]|nr:GWxTD domain-containing protein [Acidobacteriota bacterium]
MRHLPNNSMCTRVLGVAAGLFLLSAPASSVDAQSPVQTRAATLDEFPVVDENSLSTAHRKWITEIVGHIITSEEYRIWERLETDEKRDRFMERFWVVRDPTPGTPRNEYFEMHFERLAYVEKFLGRGTATAAWATDRGRTYITLGKPQMINRVPSDMLTYPLEIWFYSADPDLGLPPYFYVMFYQRYGSGNYRLYSPLSDGPQRLLNGAGEMEVQRIKSMPQYQLSQYSPTGFEDAAAIRQLLLEIDYDLASAAFSLYPAEAGMEFGITPLRSEMLLAQIDNVHEVVMPDSTWAYNVLTGVTDSDVRFETLEMSLTATPLIDIDGEPFLHFASSATGEELNISDFEGNYYFSFDAVGSVATEDNRVLQSFEANMTGDLEEEQAVRFTSQPFIYMDMVPTLPGTLTFTLMLENKAAHTFGRAELVVEVPRSRPAEVTLLGPVLVEGVRALTNYDEFAGRYPFQYRDLAMVPSVDGTFTIGAALVAFQQTLLPPGYTASLTGRIEVRDASGALVHEDSQVFEPESADDHGVLPYLWSIDTSAMNAGELQLRFSIDEIPDASALRTVRLEPPVADAGSPFVNAQLSPPASDVNVALERARQYRVLGDLDSAVRWLRDALARDPDNIELRSRHVDLLGASGLYEEVIDLLAPVVARNPRDVETMLELAHAHAERSEHYDAIRYYERARMAAKQDTPAVLNALASEYHAEGRADKARELLELSLQLNAEQPQVRRMLEQVSETVTEPPT